MTKNKSSPLPEKLGVKSHLSLSDNQLFWVLQISVWMVLGLIWYIAHTLTFGQTDWPYIIHPMLQSVLGIFISWPMRYVYHWSWKKPVRVQLPVIVGTVAFFALVWTIARLVTFIWITGETKSFLPEFGLWYFPSLLVFSCWAALYHGFRFNRALKLEHASLLKMEREKHEERLRRKNAEHLAQAAQFKMLRYQLNPHFLFNTMNAITALVSAGRNEEASNMIDSLSSFLRDSLRGDPMHRITLGEELNSLRNYLSIEQTRFGDRLEVDIDVPDQALEFKVPGMLLQPIAENVIKHAVRPTSGVIRMTISAQVLDGFLDLEVGDTGPGIQGLKKDELPDGGIGLTNVRDRLQNMYGDQSRFELVTGTGKGLKVKIRVPAAKELVTPNLGAEIASDV